MRFMAMASVSCISLEMAPYDMAPVQKRWTMAAAGPTSSSGTGSRSPWISKRPRRVRSVVELVVDDVGEAPEGRRVVGVHRLLQEGDGGRVPGVGLAVAPPLVVAAADQREGPQGAVGEGAAMAVQRLLGEHVQADAADP